MSVDDHKEALKKMASTEFNRELGAMIRSGTPLIYLVSTEENRIIEYFKHFSIISGYKVFMWDCYRGLLKIDPEEKAALFTSEDTDVSEVLDWIIKESTESSTDDEECKGKIYLFLDFHRQLDPCPESLERRLRTFHRINALTSIIMVGASYVSTPALDKSVSVIDFPYPNENEIKAALNTIVEGVGDRCTEIKSEIKKNEAEVIKAVSGFTLSEATAAFGKSVVMHRRIDLPTIIKEKQQIIRKTGVLEYCDNEITINDIGGLSNLVDWLKETKNSFSPEAKEYGIPVPRGLLLFGISGGGKSLACKAAANLFGVPLLRLDFGKMFSAYIGESEKLARDVIRICDLVDNMVLWVDEIDKGLSGHKSSGLTDSGVTNRVISTFLTWLQEKKSSVFVMCTANNIQNIPDEFMRAGRFDEVFFVDLPTRLERMEIWKVHIKRKKRNIKDFDIEALANASDNYSGAEIEKAVERALKVGFKDNARNITTEDLKNALASFKPLYTNSTEQSIKMRIDSVRFVKANTPNPILGVPVAQKRIDIEQEK